MEILKYFTPNQSIAGLEVSDNALRLVLLKTEKEKPASGAGPKKPGIKRDFLKFKKSVYVTKIAEAIEENLEEGVVEDGILKNPQLFVRSLTRLIKKAKTKVRYVVLSLALPGVYTKLFSFPSVIDDENIVSTMRLTLDMQLPVNTSEYYFDWEQHDESEGKEVLLAGAPSKAVEVYKKTLLLSDLHIVAVEISPFSIARALDASITKKPLLLAIFNKEGFTLSVLKNGLAHFNRSIPYAHRGRAAVPEEVRKVMDYYEAEYHERIEQICLAGEDVVEKKKSKEKWPLETVSVESLTPLAEKLPNPRNFLPSLGAARRGIVPRSIDRQISLMEIDTKTAFETQKAVVFAQLLSYIAIFFSIFIVVATAGILALSVAMEKTIIDGITALSAIPVPAGSAELEKKANDLNMLFKHEADLARQIPRWSVVIQELTDKTGNGITIRSVSIPSINGTLTVTGIASDRDTLRQFKKTLDESETFAEVDLPINNIDASGDIPFSLSARLKSTQTIYF